MDYLNPFDNTKVESYTSKTFGLSVRKRREQLNISLRQMAKKIGMSPIYLSDIERGNRPAPTGIISGIDYMSNLEKEMCLTDSQKKVYTLMAQISHLSATNLVNNYLINNLSSLKFLLKAIEKNLANAEWENLYQLMFEQK